MYKNSVMMSALQLKSGGVYQYQIKYLWNLTARYYFLRSYDKSKI